MRTVRFRWLVRVGFVAGLAIAGTGAKPADAQPAAPSGVIEPLRGNLFKVTVGRQVSVLLATSDGLVVVDSLGLETANWLRQELATRFPNTAIRYVVQTGHRPQRAAGASAFTQTAEVVGQERFDDERRRAAKRLPSDLASLDVDGNGALETGEFARHPDANFIQAQDLNRNGSVTADELHSRVGSVERTYRRGETIVLGRQRFFLVSAPVPDAADTTVVVFPMERFAFSADVLAPRTVPARIGSDGARQLLESLRTIENLAFDQLLTGDGTILTKSDVSVVRQYVEDVISGTRTSFAAGLSVSEAQDRTTLEKYRDWSGFTERRTLHVAEAYRIVLGHRDVRAVRRRIPVAARPRLQRKRICTLFSDVASPCDCHGGCAPFLRPHRVRCQTPPATRRCGAVPERNHHHPSRAPAARRGSHAADRLPVG